MRISDWSSDVCSSDLREQSPPRVPSGPEQVVPPGDRGTTGALGRPEEDRQAAENYGIRGHQSGKSTLTPVFAVFPVFLLLHELRERLRDRRLIRQDEEHPATLDSRTEDMPVTPEERQCASVG